MIPTRQTRQLFTAQAADGSSSGVEVAGYQIIAVQVTETGTVTTGTVTLELSINGTDWFATSGVYDAGTDTSGDIFTVVDVAATYARVTLASITGGGSVDAWLTGTT